MAVVIPCSAHGAGKASGDAIDQGIFVDLKLDHAIELAAMLGEKLFERFGLRTGARVAVEDCAGLCGHRFQLCIDQVGDDLVGNELATIHDFLGLQPHGRLRLHRSAQHVSGRKLAHAMLFDQTVRLRAFACPRWAEKNDVHGHPLATLRN